MRKQNSIAQKNMYTKMSAARTLALLYKLQTRRNSESSVQDKLILPHWPLSIVGFIEAVLIHPPTGTMNREAPSVGLSLRLWRLAPCLGGRE